MNETKVRADPPEPPYGPGAICEECGHFAMRHDEAGCHGVPNSRPCTFGAVAGKPCTGMVWNGVRWPDPQGHLGYVIIGEPIQ